MLQVFNASITSRYHPRMSFSIWAAFKTAFFSYHGTASPWPCKTAGARRMRSIERGKRNIHFWANSKITIAAPRFSPSLSCCNKYRYGRWPNWSSFSQRAGARRMQTEFHQHPEFAVLRSRLIHCYAYTPSYPSPKASRTNFQMRRSDLKPRSTKGSAISTFEQTFEIGGADPSLSFILL